MSDRWSGAIGNRWDGVVRPYTEEDVDRISGSVGIEHSLAKRGAAKLWRLLNQEDYIAALGALTGQQAVQMAKAGLKAIYVSGWQVAADANEAKATYPDQSLYPADSVPRLVERLQKALRRADEIRHSEGKEEIDYYLPMVADAEAGFGGPLNCFELMKMMIEAGAAGVHFEDQLGSAKKCGHVGGKVLVPTKQFIQMLVAARLAADVTDVPTIIIARTDAEDAELLTCEIDDRDKLFILGKNGHGVEMTYGEALQKGITAPWNNQGVEGDWTPYRTDEGYYRIRKGMEAAVARAIAYAPYADMLWMETKKPDLEEARRFAEEVHKVYPGKLLAYNCSPSFPWRKKFAEEIVKKIKTKRDELPEKNLQLVAHLGIAELVGADMPEDKITGLARDFSHVFRDDSFLAENLGNTSAYVEKSSQFGQIIDCMCERFQRELGKMGYKFQFVTLAGFHALTHSMFDLAYGYARRGMEAYVELQDRELASAERGFTATKHQREVGTGYFDEVQKIIGATSTVALEKSTEKDFK